MSAVIDLEIGAEALERSKVDLVVVGFFEDEVPLRGGAGRVDWRLCGLVSEQILAGKICGDRNSALLIPADGQLRARRVLILGLGKRSEYRQQQIAESSEEAISRALLLDAASVAMAPLGLAGDDFARCGESILTGAAAGFYKSSKSLRLRMVLPHGETNRASQAIEAALKSEVYSMIRYANGKGLPAAPSPRAMGMSQPVRGSR